MTGKVKCYNEFNGYGFIIGEDGSDYFVHWSFIEGQGYKFLKEGETVQFSAVSAHSGLQARDVKFQRKRHRLALKPNPFTPQSPITDPTRFAGRGEIIRNAVDALYNHKNIIITGERGIGKSSVAYQLCFLAQGERALLDRLEIDTEGFEFSYVTADHRCVPGNTLLDVLDSLRVSLGSHVQSIEKTKTEEWAIDLKFVKSGSKIESEFAHPTGLVAQFVEMVDRAFHEIKSPPNGLCFGSPQEFVGSGILRSFPDFLKSNVFGVGHGHSLGFQEEIAHVFVATAAVDQHTDVPVDCFYDAKANLGPAVVQNPCEVF